MMTEIFLVNYTPTPHIADKWDCIRMTHSLATASAYAKELRKMGHDAIVQSVLIDEDGRVKL